MTSMTPKCMERRSRSRAKGSTTDYTDSADRWVRQVVEFHPLTLPVEPTPLLMGCRHCCAPIATLPPPEFFSVASPVVTLQFQSLGRHQFRPLRSELAVSIRSQGYAESPLWRSCVAPSTAIWRKRPDSRSGTKSPPFDEARHMSMKCKPASQLRHPRRISPVTLENDTVDALCDRRNAGRFEQGVTGTICASHFCGFGDRIIFPETSENGGVNGRRRCYGE